MKMKTSAVLAAVLFTAMAMNACSSDEEPYGINTDRVPSSCRPAVKNETSWGSLVTASNKFGFDLILEDNGSSGYAPLALERSLRMLYEGSCGSTAVEMHNVLNLPEARNTTALLNDLEEKIINESSSPYDPARYIALYNMYSLTPFFKDLLFRELHTTQMLPVAEYFDFSMDPQKARDQINRMMSFYINDNTDEDLSKNVLPEDAFCANTNLVLCNSVNIQDHWAIPFDPEKTTKDTFNTPSGPVEVDMMHSTATYRYAETAAMQAVALDLSDRGYSFVVVLPNIQNGTDPVAALKNVKTELAKDGAEHLLAELTPTPVQISLPKFVRYNTPYLKDKLLSLGMKRAFFKDQADFSPLVTPQPIEITQVIQRVNIGINENGLKVKNAGSSKPASGISPQTILNADHPFLYMVVERPYGASGDSIILQIGQQLDFN